MTKTPAVICAPLRAESWAVRRAATPVARTGMGPARSERSTARHSDHAVLVAGVGGGLGAEVESGDLVVATEVRGPHGVVPVPSAPLLAGALRRAGLSVHLGPIASQPHVVTGSARVALAAHGALAVDTESAWLAPGAGMPYAVIRAIVDTSRDPLIRPGTVPRGIAALRNLSRAVPAIDAWAAALRPRELILARPRAFCAGVERAIDIVEAAIERFGAPIYVRRQIVHNSHVVADLEGRGAVFVNEVDEVPAGRTVVLAAHGVAPAVRAQANARGLAVIDATCPLVAKVHTEVKRYASRDTTVFLIGHHDHEEVEGTVGEAPDQIMVVPDVAAAATVMPPNPTRVAYAMQTTLALDEAEEIASILRGRFPALAGPRRDDICYATTNRQQAVRAIARDCDLVVVLGSANSSNSVRLVEVAAREGVPAILIDDPSDLDLGQLAGAGRIGITAGASAPPHLVDDLVRALSGLGPIALHEAEGVAENVHFTLPKEVS
jgi:4-hydroxy-3-methylbut-2-enyl diphosphate reductase